MILPTSMSSSLSDISWSDTISVLGEFSCRRFTGYREFWVDTAVCGGDRMDKSGYGNAEGRLEVKAELWLPKLWKAFVDGTALGLVLISEWSLLLLVARMSEMRNERLAGTVSRRGFGHSQMGTLSKLSFLGECGPVECGEQDRGEAESLWHILELEAKGSLVGDDGGDFGAKSSAPSIFSFRKLNAAGEEVEQNAWSKKLTDFSDEYFGSKWLL